MSTKPPFFDNVGTYELQKGTFKAQMFIIIEKNHITFNQNHFTSKISILMI